MKDELDNIFSSQGRIVNIFTEVHDGNDDYQRLLNDNPDDALVLVVRNTVIFPFNTTPIAVARDKSMAVIKEAERTKRPIVVVCQRDPNVDDPTPEDLFYVGTQSTIIKVFHMPDGSLNVILLGRAAVAINEYIQTEPFFKAKILPQEISAPAKTDKEFKALTSSIRKTAMEMFKKMENGGAELAFALRNIKEPVMMFDFLAGNLSFDFRDKQTLLEESDLMLKGYKLYELLQKEAQLVELKANITSRTHEDITQQQREHFLQQQIKAIQHELGNDGDDIEALRERAERMDWDEATAEAFQKDLKKLERINPQSPDYAVEYTHLDTILSLPWRHCSKDSFNLTRVENKLNRDHYGLEKVKDRILEHLAVLKLRGDLKAPILCLYGPPGVGKTSLGRSVAEALGRKYARISLGGLHDEAEIRGHRRTYIGAMPGRIIDAIKRCGTSNPVIVLDEIDKVGQDFKGDPAAALLEVLDPEQNNKFHDNFIDLDYDLSKVLFIATANNVGTISQPLLDRMELIEINSYILEEKVEIARRHLVPKQLEANGFEKREVTFGKPVLAAIISGYTRESGVRELEKQISKVLRKLARKKAQDEKDYPTTIAVKDLPEYLGPIKFDGDQVEDNNQIGVVTGLAWTAVGGEILFIESSLSPGKGDKLTLTGNLGDVMKESAVIALEYIKANSKQLGIDPDVFEKNNVHIHVPEGAIPKDGPSAGVTMVTSLVSSFTGRKVKPRIAMTGEITLRGKVLPVGGIKEKILAAKRAGVKTVILCSKNKKDIDDINEMYVKGLSFNYVDDIQQVLKLSFDA